MDEDGANVTPIAPMNIGSALHPTPLRDGRLMFTHATRRQGLRDSASGASGRSSPTAATGRRS